jgi:hypothetical protein
MGWKEAIYTYPSSIVYEIHDPNTDSSGAVLVFLEDGGGVVAPVYSDDNLTSVLKCQLFRIKTFILHYDFLCCVRLHPPCHRDTVIEKYFPLSLRNLT